MYKGCQILPIHTTNTSRRTVRTTMLYFAYMYIYILHPIHTYIYCFLKITLIVYVHPNLVERETDICDPSDLQLGQLMLPLAVHQRLRLDMQFLSLFVALHNKLSRDETSHTLLHVPRFGRRCDVRSSHQHGSEKLPVFFKPPAVLPRLY